MKVCLILLTVATIVHGQRFSFPGEENHKENTHEPIAPPIPEGAHNSDQSGAQPEARFLGLFGGPSLLGGLFGGGHGGGGGHFGGGQHHHGGGHGGGGGLFGGNLFCRSCSFNNPVFANECCQRGEQHCCRYSNSFPVGPGGGFGGFKPTGFKPGPPGSIGGGGGNFGGGNHGFFGRDKHGFCPKPSLLGGLFGRSGISDDPTAIGDEGKKEHNRVARQASSSAPKTESASHEPSSRFLPGLSKLPNIFCRDQCFSDFDCPGILKCCLNISNCRDCIHPRFF